MSKRFVNLIRRCLCRSNRASKNGSVIAGSNEEFVDKVSSSNADAAKEKDKNSIIDDQNNMNRDNQDKGSVGSPEKSSPDQASVGKRETKDRDSSTKKGKKKKNFDDGSRS